MGRGVKRAAAFWAIRSDFGTRWGLKPRSSGWFDGIPSPVGLGIKVLGGFGGDNALRANADLGLCREKSQINP